MGRRRNGEAPQIRLHAHRGQPRVRINGQVSYLVCYGSPESNAANHRLLAEWRATSGNVFVPEAVPVPTGDDDRRLPRRRHRKRTPRPRLGCRWPRWRASETTR
jgi:hypothetical protein